MPKQYMSKQHYKPSSYSPRTTIGYLVKRSHALLLDLVEPALLVRGFTFTQYIVLAYLRDGIAINPKDFCAEFRHDSGAFTRVIDQLAQRGFVDRLRGQQDRRKVDLQLTPAGRKAVESLIPLVVDGLNTALEAFTAAEVGELARLLVKLNNTLDVRVAARPDAARPDAARPDAARPITAREKP
jgi:DNA-binding MarR family transcriptional regulator